MTRKSSFAPWIGTVGLALVAALAVACGGVPAPSGPTSITPTPSTPASSSTPDMSPVAPPDGGVGTTSGTTGCSGYLTCLEKATTDPQAMACDKNVTQSGGMLFAATFQCAGDFCSGKRGGTTRCKFDAQGNPQNLNGTAAFDANGNETGDCGACLDNSIAALFGAPCQPTTDPACNTAACAPSVMACMASKP